MKPAIPKITRTDLALAARCLMYSSAAVEGELQRRRHPLQSRYAPRDRRYSLNDLVARQICLRQLLGIVDKALGQPRTDVKLFFTGGQKMIADFLSQEIALAERAAAYTKKQSFSNKEQAVILSALAAELKLYRCLFSQMENVQ